MEGHTRLKLSSKPSLSPNLMQLDRDPLSVRSEGKLGEGQRVEIGILVGPPKERRPDNR